MVRTHQANDGQQISDAEMRRLEEDRARTANWKRWGPYLAERQWGTIREDYSTDGDAWRYFPHEQARSRAYRWGEDGLLGICDRECRLCFALALWNGRDPILKERLFGVTGPEGNHGEDCKECYFYLDSTPTHSYMKALYKYPQAEFPYDRLVAENRRRGKLDPEFELADTGVFDDGYFDVFVEYAKAAPDDVLIRITAANRGPAPAVLHLLPTLWFRNTWSWGCAHEGCWPKPFIRWAQAGSLFCHHATLGRFHFAADALSDGREPTFLFTENETNAARLFDAVNNNPHVKDAFHDYVVAGRSDAVNPKEQGTKAAASYRVLLPAGAQATLKLRLYSEESAPAQAFGSAFDQIFKDRIREADEFYGRQLARHESDGLSLRARPANDESNVVRQAFAGLLWTKQFYHYVVKDWLSGDPEQPAPPEARKAGRNHDWPHLYNRDVISMPDKWEYPWYAAWDLAFHMIPFARIDPAFAKEQLVLFLREWYMHPNGQMPAYEWALSDVNPPVHAWACWRVYKMTGPAGQRDRLFLSRVFQKLLINFTWWVNRKDITGKHLFSGGFLGLDNIGMFDRSRPLPNGGHLEQADGTAWMAFYCATMLAMALELARDNPATEDVASKFFEHFVAIADAMNTLGGTGLWDEQDGFYYDRLHTIGHETPTRIRSLVGLIPLVAVEVLEDAVIERLPGFRKRLQWFLDNRKDLAQHIAYMQAEGACRSGRRLLAIPSRERLEKVLRYLLDENEFLSPYGIRSLSRFHEDHPHSCAAGGQENRVAYVPGDSDSGMFGGNSNWRGPVWFPVNYLLIEALERYHHFYGDSLRVECPTGSGRLMNLAEVAQELAGRLKRLFLPDAQGRRPCHGTESRFADDPCWKDLLLFYEYFHGDNGRGLGASHQTGWTALVTRLFEMAPCREMTKKRARRGGHLS
ncbi:MAG: glucosidase [Gemmataceae bacterium]|nr:glucosidase [Gemmataceae bacterium]MCI0740844.1 glucosidase [Gemmataceae bacterium]